MPSGPAFDWFCSVAGEFWRDNVRPDTEQVVLVEALTQDVRVLLRNLTVANALRRQTGARLVVYSGTDAEWAEVVWSYFDYGVNARIAEAYGASQVFDVHALVDARVAGVRTPFEVAGVDVGGDLPPSALSSARLERITDATVCRLAKVPRVGNDRELIDRRVRTHSRTLEFARVFDALHQRLDVVALISSHVDYNNWGVAVESALRHDVPVLFPQSTGGLKSYQLLPQNLPDDAPIRAGLTLAIGEFFETCVWPHREALASPAELTAWRAKVAMGAPAWWRASSARSRVDLADADERAVLRRYAARRVGLDPDKPIVTVFNHAVSDALGTNHEAYDDLGQWFEETARLAATRDDVGWLFLDHPVQDIYDGSDFFGRVAARYIDHEHLRFCPSTSLSKNFVVALTDLVLTVRGSCSNEYPALGIPALQAGWSEWSHCGFTTVATTPQEYVAALEGHLERLVAGQPCMSEEQVERARIWGWFYRAASDVTTGLVPQWSLGSERAMLNALSVNMREPESDGDPAFTAVARLWHRKEPFLTRTDFQADDEAVMTALATVRGR